MRIYHSACELGKRGKEVLGIRKISILRSFHPRPNHERPEYCDNMFLDSGAYSAHTRGVAIDLDKYCSYVQEHGHRWSIYASLDVIGDAKATYQNQLIMERRGLKPLPCFHFGEDPKWLDQYIDLGYENLALGGMVGSTNPNELVWFKMCFRLIEKADRPIRVHGYGMTDPKIMHMFPWFSVDSTTAHMAAKVGLLITPDGFRHVWTGGRNKDYTSKGAMEKLRDWAHDFHPGLDWDLASEYAGEGQVYRTALNVSFMEEEWTKPPSKKGGGFGLL